MKKVWITLLILILAVGTVFARGQQGRGGFPQIGVAIYKFDDTFMSYIHNAIEKSAQSKAVVTIVDSQNAQPVQNDQMDQFIAKKMQTIVINPVDRTTAGSMIDKARTANIPIVFLNREPFPEDMAMWNRVYYVGARAQDSGTMQGEIIAEFWKAHPEADKNEDGIIQYIMLKGEPGHQDTELRTEFSIKAVLAAGLKVQVLVEDTALWDMARAVQKMDAFYAQFGDEIEAVFCNNDDMALGVIESLRKAGYFTGRKYLPVVGVDATAPALKALAEGSLLGTVLNDARNQGKATFDIAYALATGADIKSAGWPITNGKYIWIPYQKVTRDNYKDFL
jgi:methyl-galactoside transport system substrate-binding protein